MWLAAATGAGLLALNVGIAVKLIGKVSVPVIGSLLRDPVTLLAILIMAPTLAVIIGRAKTQPGSLEREPADMFLLVAVITVIEIAVIVLFALFG